MGGYNKHIIANKTKSVTLISHSVQTKVWLQQKSFTVVRAKYFAIENLTFESDYTERLGNIEIKQSEALSIKGCRFRSVGITVSSNNATITECTFNNISFHYRSEGNSFNKHIYILESIFVHNAVSTILQVEGSQLHIIHCTFTNNYSDKDGGAVTIIGNEASVVITECEFVTNYATDYGGAIYFKGANSIYIQHTSFISNTAEVRSGGAVYMEYESNNMEMVNCTFSDNNATGSVVYALTNSLYILNCKFTDYTTLTNKFSTIEIKVSKHAFINDTIITNNYAEISGGIQVREGSNKVYITNCQLTGNHAKNFGGAIDIETAAKVVIINSIFSNNTAHQGGAIHLVHSGDLQIINCVFTNNYASWENSGGAISTSFPIKVGPPFTSYISSTIIDWGDLIIGTIIIKDTTFLNNSGSGAITIYKTSASIENTSFYYNKADDQFGALNIMQSTLTVRHVTFTKNNGNIYLFNSEMKVTGPVTLSGNMGGGIYAVQSKMYIKSGELGAEILITGNTAFFGGGIKLKESEMHVQSPIMILGNWAELFGGGIYAYKSLIDFTFQKYINIEYIERSSNLREHCSSKWRRCVRSSFNN